jgi:hypothetical protein
MFSDVYTGVFSWLTYPTSNCLLVSATKIIYTKSYVNSRKDISIVEFAGPEQDISETVNVGRISKGTSTEQDLGIIKKRARLYAYIILIPVSNRTRLGTSLAICRKNTLWQALITSINNSDFISKGSMTARRSARLIVVPIPTKVIISASSKNYSIELTGKE